MLYAIKGERDHVSESFRENKSGFALEPWKEAGVSVSKNENQTGKQDQLCYKYPFNVWKAVSTF